MTICRRGRCTGPARRACRRSIRSSPVACGPIPTLRLRSPNGWSSICSTMRDSWRASAAAISASSPTARHRCTRRRSRSARPATPLRRRSPRSSRPPSSTRPAPGSIETLARLPVASRRLMGGTKGSHFVTHQPRIKELLGGHGIYTEARDGRPVFILPFMDGDARRHDGPSLRWRPGPGRGDRGGARLPAGRRGRCVSRRWPDAERYHAALLRRPAAAVCRCQNAGRDHPPAPACLERPVARAARVAGRRQADDVPFARRGNCRGCAGAARAARSGHQPRPADPTDASR